MVPQVAHLDEVLVHQPTAGRVPRWQELGRPSTGGHTKAELYAEARKRGVEGRSTMTKAQLQRAVQNR